MPMRCRIPIMWYIFALLARLNSPHLQPIPQILWMSRASAAAIRGIPPCKDLVGKAVINFGATTGHEYLRASIVGASQSRQLNGEPQRALTTAEIAELRK